ncbi:MAG: ABC transporter ATP-binding protein [Bacteroidetes bacterium]|nr:ABC transporter ATP-binding protein [Bacteroidota bacterium]
MAQDSNIIALTGIVKSYEGGHRALDHLTLSVPRGSICGVVGLNGAGKSTTMRILAGLEEADSGDVEMLGAHAPFRDPGLKRRVGFVLDEPFYFDWLSAREYLEWMGNMHGLGEDVSARRPTELLEVLDLPSDDAKLIRAFSTGMKKKVSIAAAMIHAPELLILDEPLEAVDAVAARSIKDALLSLSAKGATIVLTSHVLDSVERFCTHLCVIHRGRALLECRMEQLRETAAGMMDTGTAETLEDLFVKLVAGDGKPRRLTYV